MWIKAFSLNQNVLAHKKQFSIFVNGRGALGRAPLCDLAVHGLLPRGGRCSWLSHLVWCHKQHRLCGDPQLCHSVQQNTIQIKLRWALFVTYTIIQSIMMSEMCSLHLTFPSAHTPWSSGQPTVQRPGSSRGLPPGAGIRTHNLGLPRVSSPTLYPLGHDCNDGSSVATGSGSPSSVVSGFGSAQWGDGGLGSGSSWALD